MDSVKHNYTEERQQWLGNPTLEEIRANILKLKQDPSNPLKQQETRFCSGQSGDVARLSADWNCCIRRWGQTENRHSIFTWGLNPDCSEIHS